MAACLVRASRFLLSICLILSTASIAGEVRPDYVVNRGHYFGTQLSDVDKRALIAFVKMF